MKKLILRKIHTTSQPDISAALQQIKTANDSQISEIIQAVIRRYKVVYPGWEVIFLSLPLEPKERSLMVEQTIDQLKKL